jgi:hypothetical protein
MTAGAGLALVTAATDLDALVWMFKGIGVGILWLGLLRLHPMRRLQRGIVLARALVMLASSMMEAAWERRGRWNECCVRAQREV